MRYYRTYIILSTLALSCCIVAHASAAIFFDTLGDTTYETVYTGGGDNESLAKLVSGYRDPHTGAADPILSADGRPLVVGANELNEDPSYSDQSQVQRFLVKEEDESIRVRYLGLGGAGYKSIFGAYYYPEEGDINQAEYAPLFVQNVSTVGSESVFTVPAGHYFGFYLDANGHISSRGKWHTENKYNSDNPASSKNDLPGSDPSNNGIASENETDHFLVFNTNKGVMLAVEDLPRDGNGRLGDQDYEDLIVGFVTKANRESLPMPQTPFIPEPSSWLILMVYVICIISFCRIRYNNTSM